MKRHLAEKYTKNHLWVSHFGTNENPVFFHRGRYYASACQKQLYGLVFIDNTETVYRKLECNTNATFLFKTENA